MEGAIICNKQRRLTKVSQTVGDESEYVGDLTNTEVDLQ